MSFRQRFRKSFSQAKEDLASLFKDKDESHTRPSTPIDKTRHSKSLVDVTDSSDPGLHRTPHTKMPTDQYLHPHYTPSHAKSFERMPLGTTSTQKDHLGTSNHVRASSSPANPHISELGSKRVGPDVVNVAELASRLSKTPRAQAPRAQTPGAQTPTKQFFHPRLRNVGTKKPSEGLAQVANQNYRKEEHLGTVDNRDRAFRPNISAPVDKGLKPLVRPVTPTRNGYVAPADNRVRPLNVRATADPGPGFRFPKTPSPRPEINPNRYLQPYPNNTCDIDKSVKGSTRIAKPNQNDRMDAVDVDGQALDSNIAAPVDSGARTPKPGVREIGSDAVPSRAEQDGVGTAKLQTTEQPPPVVADTPSIKWKGVKEFARVLEPLTNLFGPVKEMTNLLVECVEKYELAEESKGEYDALRIRLDGIFEILNVHFGKECSPIMTSSIGSLCRSIQGELEYIKGLQKRNVVERYLLATDDSNRVLACYRRIEGHLQRLSLNVNFSMWRIVQEHAADSRSDRMSSRIEHLPSSLSAWYNSAEGIELKRRECTPGTRVNVLANLLDWARSGGGGVYWLNGMAGTGKTTIAYSVCADLDARQQLGGSFFCSRLREECRDVNLIIPSIAYQLARFSRPFQYALSKVLEKDPDVHGRQPHMQFDALIAKPILEVQHTLPEELIVVIDALDECDQKESTERMLDVLLSKSTNLPIMFIVSSRPEPQIRDQMTHERVKSRLVLHELDKGEVQADIDRYLREGLAQMNPSEAEITSLVERAGILFIYAATAVRYISYDNFHRNPGARLRTILNRPDQITAQSTEIDDLYTTILEAAFGDKRIEVADRVDMQQVLNAVISTREPLTVTGLSELLQINDPHRVRSALRPLWSVLHVVGESELVTTLHASFPDFMFDPARSRVYHCDLDAYHFILAEHCFARIKRTEPQFNICGIESSYLPDKMVTCSKGRVGSAITLDLLYACRHWADHVEAGKCAAMLTAQLKDFLSNRLLLWMEVLNLNKQLKAGMESTKSIVKWCSGLDSEDELVELADDAQRFVDTFASNPVSQSTPHIYLSMLTFWPKSAPIAKYYAHLSHGPVKVEGTALDQRQLARLATWVFEHALDVMAVSEKYIALGAGTNVLVLDSSGGQVVLGPLHGLTEKVRSIIFSPDQTRVLAGSFGDKTKTATVIGWDIRTGDTIVGPLQLGDHKDSIRCLILSPDCTRIVTGSGDWTVRLWDTADGRLLRCLKAPNEITAIAFSSDGAQVAAGFHRTLEVWNSQTGDTTFGPRNIGTIDMIAFSPDKSRIIHAGRYVSRSIYVLNAQNGNTIREVDYRDKDTLRCIAYSPDGRHIVSGSADGLVRLWDAQTGKMVLGPLEGHAGRITSVAFSPDGSRIISACKGGFVCIWNTQQHNIAHTSINTHSNDILLTKFSSDGKRFVSGSKDGKLHIRDSHTGAMILGPIKIHTGQVRAVDFLNDHITLGFKDGTICVSSALSGQVTLGPLKVSQGDPIQAIAYSPNGSLIATGSGGGSSSEVNLWDARTGTRILGPLRDLGQSILTVQFSPDAARIVASASSTDRQIVVWSIPSGKNVFGSLNGHSSSVKSISYSPNGALFASGSSDKTIIVWNAYTGTKVLDPLTGHSSVIRAVHFSPDSTRLISGSDDRTIQIWDVRTGETIFELPHGHEQAITSVAYSADGTRILSLSTDMSVRIHDARSAQERALSRCATEIGDWTINKDGWVVDDRSRLLVWVPGDLRKALMCSGTRVMIAPWGYVRLKFDKSRMGESWKQSYMSQS